MPAERFYINTSLTCGEHVELEEEEFAHLRVMRPKVGDIVELINGRHALAHAEIITINKKSATLAINLVEEHAPLAPSITLGIALPRFSHLEWLIEKATELGANTFWLFPGDKSEKKNVSEQQLLRLHNLMVAAMKQCGRLDMPHLEIHPALSTWHYPPQGTIFFGDTAENAPLLAKHIPQKAKSIIFFTGPEAGFSTQEELLLKNVWHAQGVSLHPYILRAETAPILALGLLRHALYS